MNLQGAMQGLPGDAGLSNGLTVEPARGEAEVRSEIMEAVRRSGILNPRDVGVAVTGGLVRLSGTVGWLQDRSTVSAIAWTTPGVVGIENCTEVG